MSHCPVCAERPAGRAMVGLCDPCARSLRRAECRNNLAIITWAATRARKFLDERDKAAVFDLLKALGPVLDRTKEPTT